MTAKELIDKLNELITEKPECAEYEVEQPEFPWGIVSVKLPDDPEDKTIYLA